MFLLAAPGAAQLKTTLKPETLHGFEKYASEVESDLQQRSNGERPFLALDDTPTDRARVLKGELVIRQGSDKASVIPDGLVHDWIGDVFIPHKTPEDVLSILEDFDRHQKIYPGVVRSRLIERHNHTVIGEWRLAQKSGLLAIVLQVRIEARYQQIAPGKWTGRAYANQISDVDHAGSKNETVYPPGEGYGFLWRLFAYWSLEATDGGVLAENRSLSLTRDIPQAVAWMVRPFVQEIPRQALQSTLLNTRKAVEQ